MAKQHGTRARGDVERKPTFAKPCSNATKKVVENISMTLYGKTHSKSMVREFFKIAKTLVCVRSWIGPDLGEKSCQDATSYAKTTHGGSELRTKIIIGKRLIQYKINRDHRSLLILTCLCFYKPALYIQSFHEVIHPNMLV